MASRPLRVFLSFAGSDAKVASEIRRELRAARLETWDSSDVEPGDNPWLRTGKELDRADVVVTLLSPAASKSKWVRWEITHALSGDRFANRLVPVTLRPTDELPWILGHIEQVDASRDLSAGISQLVARLRKMPARTERRSPANTLTRRPGAAARKPRAKRAAK